MATIAQITDLHLVEDDYAERPLGPRARLSYLSFGRPLAPVRRRERVKDALQAVRAANVDHLLITGDLTEDGHPEQFEVLAELLADSRIPAEHVTLVPGNHDAYGCGDAFAAALRGPLRAYAPTSTMGAPIALRDVTLVPVSTAFHQSCLRSAGAISGAELENLGQLAKDPALAGRPLVLAQHHQPGRYYLPIWQWIDGLVEHRALGALFERCPHLYVIHGHTHRAADKSFGEKGIARIFSARAVVDSDSPMRLYEASPAGLCPVPFDLEDGLGAEALPA